MTHIKGCCPHNCPDTCGWVVTLDDAGTPTHITGDPDHPYTQGWLCSKVNRYLEFVFHPDRLRTPLRRVGTKGEGRFEPVSWDAALDEIVGRWQEIIAKHGPEGILPYSYSGTLGGVHAEVCNHRLWTRMGASGLERALCSASGTEAMRLTVGASIGADPEDFVNSRLLLLWGTNPASTHPHMIPWIDEARRRGAKVWLIDPHRTLTANRADVHLMPRPGSDGALALGLMHLLFANGWVDEPWAREHTLGFDQLRERVREWTPERTAEATGIALDQLHDLARDYGTIRPSVIRCSMGLQRHSNGGATIRALACLPALVGDYGQSGGGILFSTGGFWPWPESVVCPPELRENSPNPQPRVLNTNRLGAELLEADPPVRSLFVFNSNPATVAPNSRRILKGLAREDLFTVVHDLFLTDTAKWADIVLPSTSQFERWDLHKSYGHLYVQLNRPVMPPLGEAKSNWEVHQLLAERLGYTEACFQQSEETIIQALLREGGEPVAHIAWEELLENGYARLNYPRPHVPFADGKFFTPSGKVELYSQQLADAGLDPLPGFEPDVESREGNSSGYRRYPLQLVSAASHHFLNSTFANLPSMRHRHGDPTVELHPDDARERDIRHGDWVEVANDRGAFLARARVTDAVQPGTVFTPTLWWTQHAPDGRGANWTTNDALADYAGGATFHGNLVEVSLAMAPGMEPSIGEAEPAVADD